MSNKSEWLFNNIVPCLRQDVFATAFYSDGKIKYQPSKHAIALNDVKTHIAGELPVGQYLILEDGKTVRAAVLDFDDKEKVLSWETMSKAAARVMEELQKEKMFPFVVRSGGGRGIHLWMFWREPQSAKDVRDTFFRVLKRLGVDTASSIKNKLVVDEQKVAIDIYPSQDSVEAGKLGNLVALPFARQSIALNPNTFEPVEDLASIPYSFAVQAAPIEEMMFEGSENAGFENYEPEEIDIVHVKSALKHVSSEDYGTWTRVGMALKLAAEKELLTPEEALDIWLEWSATTPDKFNDKAARKTWASFHGNHSRNVTMGSVFHWAKEGGFVPPRGTRSIPAKPPQTSAEVPAAERDPDTADEIYEVNQDHFFTMDQGKARVVCESYDHEMKRPMLTMMHPSDFGHKYQNRSVQVRSTDKRGKAAWKPEELAKAWMKSPERRQYEGITFSPAADAPVGYYNLWRGFAVQPAEGDWSMYRRHMFENICRSNTEHFDYLIKWMAYTLQYPDEPIGVAIVLKGPRGTGKGSFVHPFGKLLQHHYLQVANGRQVTGNFNLHLRDTICLFADEAVWAGNKADEGVLKMLITEPTIPIEGKGRDIMNCRNMVHLIMATNNDWAIPAGLDERRFFVLDVSDKQKQNIDYFVAMKKQMVEQGGQAALLKFLLEFDLTGFKPMEAPKTDALMQQKMYSLDSPIQWWYNCLENGRVLPGQINWTEWLPVDRVYEEYVRYSKQYNARHIVTMQALRIALAGRVLPVEYPKAMNRTSRAESLASGDGFVPTRDRKTHWKFPELLPCRGLFERASGHRIDWPDDNDLDGEAI